VGEENVERAPETVAGPTFSAPRTLHALHCPHLPHQPQ
jgi:hypothetical protein